MSTKIVNFYFIFNSLKYIFFIYYKLFEFLDILYNYWAEHFAKQTTKKFNFVNLIEIFGFKLNSKKSTKVQIGIVSNFTKFNDKFFQMEFLIERQSQINLYKEANTSQLFKLVSIDYGAELDLKEEIFRDFLSILHLVFFLFYKI